jgi:hypothetical protein
MEEVNSVRQWPRVPWASAQTPDSSRHTSEVDVIHISLMDELLACNPRAFVCFVHGMSQDAFDP